MEKTMNLYPFVTTSYKPVGSAAGKNTKSQESRTRACVRRKTEGNFVAGGTGQALEDPVSTTTTMVAAGVLKDFEKGSTRRRPWNSSAGSSVPHEKASEIVSERRQAHNRGSDEKRGQHMASSLDGI